MVLIAGIAKPSHIIQCGLYSKQLALPFIWVLGLSPGKKNTISGEAGRGEAVYLGKGW